jgi:hypothetical protein
MILASSRFSFSTNIAIVLSGIDQQTKTFTEPPDQIKKEITTKLSPRRRRERTWPSLRPR